MDFSYDKNKDEGTRLVEVDDVDQEIDIANKN